MKRQNVSCSKSVRTSLLRDFSIVKNSDSMRRLISAIGLSKTRQRRRRPIEMGFRGTCYLCAYKHVSRFRCHMIRHLEARGVEPLSPKRSTQTSTCLSGGKVYGAERCTGTLPAPERPRNSFTVRRGHSAERLACCPRLAP